MYTCLLPAVLTATIGFGGAAFAQDAAMPQAYLPQNGGAGIRTGNITATGATVPKPGLSQSGGETPLDRSVQKQDNQIDYGICKGC